VGLFVGTKAQLAASKKPKGRSKGGKAFDKAFAVASKNPKTKTFSFGGKSYSTKMAGASKSKGGKKAVAAVGKRPEPNAPSRAPTLQARAAASALPDKTKATPGKRPVGKASASALPNKTTATPAKRPTPGKASVSALPKTAPKPTPSPRRDNRAAEAAKANPPSGQFKTMRSGQDKLAAGSETRSSFKPRPAVVTAGAPATAKQKLDKRMAQARTSSAKADKAGERGGVAVAAVKPPVGGRYTLPKTKVFGNVPRPAPATRQPSLMKPIPNAPLKPLPSTVVKAGGATAAAPNTFSAKDRIAGAMSKAKVASAAADRRSAAPPAGVAGIVRPGTSTPLPSRARPTSAKAVVKKFVGVRR
jgi:hypothetical protein